MGVARCVEAGKQWSFILTHVWLSSILFGTALAAAPQTPQTPGRRSQAAVLLPSSLPPSTELGVRGWFGTPGPEPPKRAWQRDKNPRVAMFSSLLVPGLGQLYNERGLWALVAAGVQFGFLADVVIQQRLTNRYRALKNIPLDADATDAEKEQQQAYEVLFLLHRDNRIQSTWLLGLTMILSAAQSYVDAHLFDFDVDAPLQFGPSIGRLNGGALRLRF